MLCVYYHQGIGEHPPRSGTSVRIVSQLARRDQRHWIARRRRMDGAMGQTQSILKNRGDGKQSSPASPADMVLSALRPF